jgi:2-octaprenyl-6-methoxyphenol hydroxylase
MAENTYDTDVVIAGGGLVGLPLAIAFAGKDGETGLGITVVDEHALQDHAVNVVDSRAFALSASSVNMLKKLQIWDDIAQYAQAVNEISITDSRLEDLDRPELLHFDNHVDDDETASCIVEGSHVRKAVQNVAKNCKNLIIVENQTVCDFRVDEAGVNVHLTDGREIRARLLVAADGKASKLRRIADIKTVTWPTDQWGIVATINHEKSHKGKAVQHFMEAGPFAMLPLVGNRTSLVWTEHSENAAEIAKMADQEFIDEVRRRFGDELGEISLEGERSAFPLSILLAQEYVQSRFCLVGDAAHTMHWIAGQGLNYGLRGAAALAETIIDARYLGQDIGNIDVLKRYERWRRFDSVSFTTAMLMLNKLFSNSNPLARAMRDFGLGIVDKTPILKGLIVKEAAGLSGDLPRLLVRHTRA